MVKFPNAKINLGLRITGKRTDGYHELETIFYPVPFCDALEITANSESEYNSFVQTGLAVPGNENENLCLRAYQLVKQLHPGLPAIKIHLHKAIPMGAGLGGGSADAAFTLQMLNEYFELRLNEKVLADQALKLGSDCPFFLKNIPCLATGRGEQLTPVECNLSNHQIVIIYSQIHVSTAWAFSRIKPNMPKQALIEVIKMPINKWQDNLVNDFEAPVFDAYPLLSEIKQYCISQGAVYTSLTGSGSAIFSIFKQGKKPALNLPEGCFYKWI